MGPGEYRGGLGYRKEFELLADAYVNAYQDRHQRGAPGIEGGGDGAPNAVMFRVDGVWGTAVEHFGAKSSSKFTAVPVRSGSAISMIAGGGGGYGDPRDRSAEAVARDNAFGYVRPEAGVDGPSIETAA